MPADGSPSAGGAVATLARAIAAAPLRGIDATLCRAVRTKYLERVPPEPLFFLGSSRAGARYTPLGGPPALYLATDQATAFAEIQDLFFDAPGRPRPLLPRDPVTLVCVRVALGGVLDLTDDGTLRRLSLGADALRAEWRPGVEAWLAGTGAMPLTQRVGLAAHLTGRVGGIWFRSARVDHGRCLAVFPDRLSPAAGDRVEAYDTSGRYAQRLSAPEDAAGWRHAA